MFTDVIILAAGQGSRMKSKLPKVLHCVAGKPMVKHVIDNAKQLGDIALHIVIGHGAQQLKDALLDEKVNFALQAEQLGTGHAVARALPLVNPQGVSLILYGDVPLTHAATLEKLISSAKQGHLGLLTVKLANPTGYGRIIRNAVNDVVAIVEQKDASPEQLTISEVNTGIMAVPTALLNEWLPQLSANNAQGEYYLTDIIAMAASQGVRIEAQHPNCEQEVQGVNNRMQLAELERWYQRQQAEQLMINGATLADPSRVDVRGEVVQQGGDQYIDINTVFEGRVVLGQGVVIDPNCTLTNCEIGDFVHIKANSVLESCKIAEHCDVGPFARIRPGTELAAGVKVGNFVETKKAIIGEGSKVSHLTYIGDALIGKNVNIGAGTITCNYDGVNKFVTEIGDESFIGSNTALVAPVKVGAGATVGAGSTVTKEVPAGQLAVTRSKQINIENWQRPVKKTK
jgi:bifunctional UDP-N-acetylglucosamine pyrophosphorylase/glucosamine-1-phosphate N-acetyltransferase